MKKQILLAATAMTLMTGAAYADAPGFYVTGDGGVALLPELKIHLAGINEKENFNTGEAFGGAVGYDFGNGFHAEVDGLYTKSDLDKVGGIHTSGHVAATSVMLNGIYDFTQDTVIIPFVGAGLGEVDVETKLPGAHDDDWTPGYQVLGGLRHDFSSTLSGFAEYRFQQSEAAKLTLAGVPAKQNFANNGVLIGLSLHTE